MAKRVKEDKTDIETWLLSFEKLAGRPVVVSLLIEDGDIDFVSAIRKKTYMLDDNIEDPENEPPTINFNQAKKDNTDTYLKSRDYIG